MPTPVQKRILLNTINRGLSFLFRDNFTSTWLNSLASPRTSLPGPGTLTITDTNQKLSIVGGKLSFATGGVGSGDPGAWGAQLARVVGRAVVAEVTLTSDIVRAGWDSDQASTASEAIGFTSPSTIEIRSGPSDVGNWVVSTSYKTASILRSAGLLHLVKGGTFTNWTLLFVTVAGTANLYPVIQVGDSSTIATSDFLRVLDLPAPFSTDYGLATQRLAGARSNGDTFTHAADCVIEWTETTVPSSGSTSIKFRMQDASNYWMVVINPSGSMSLEEIVATVDTSRASVGAATVANGHRIVVVADGATIRVYSNNVLRFTYASASNFVTATAGILNNTGTGGAVSDIVAWPRTITGSPATLLDNAIAGTGTFLLNDDFEIREGGSLPSPRVAEPGPGVLTIVDTGNKISIAGGKLVSAGGGTQPDPGVWGQVLTRMSGLALVSDVSLVNYNYDNLGFGTASGGVGLQASIYFYGGVLSTSALSGQSLGAYVTGTSYKVAVVTRATGDFVFVKGGIYTNWTLIWVNATGATASLYPSWHSRGGGSSLTLDFLRVLQLSAPFDADYGIATQRLAGARSAGDTFTHEANCVIEFVATTIPSSGNIRFRFRKQDSTNYWYAAVNSAGDFTLFETVAGAPTSRAVAGGVVSNGHRIVIVADGTTIKGYSNNVLRWTYSSASNFATATAGELFTLDGSSVVSDIISWPRVLGAAPAALLDAAIA